MQELLERLYRQNAGVLTAALTRVLGPGRLDAVEAVLHDTFVAALEAWPRSGLPENPAAWLTTVARNRAFDLRKGERRRQGADVDVESMVDRDADPAKRA